MPKNTIVYSAFLLVGAMCFGVLAQGGLDEASVRLAIRLTAATSFLLLLCTFIARPLHQLTQLPLGRILVRNRRQFGIAVGVSHSLHLLMIFLLVPVAFDNDVSKLGSLSDNFVGIVLYVLLYAMTFTSNNASRKALGRLWTYLHRTGSYALMLAFTGAYLRNAIETGYGYYWLLAVVGVAAFGLRFVNWRKSLKGSALATQAPLINE